jgi:hypothetical protein
MAKSRIFEITGICMEARMPSHFTPKFDANHGVTFAQWTEAVDRVLIIRCGMTLDRTWVGTSVYRVPESCYIKGMCPVAFVKQEFPRNARLG